MEQIYIVENEVQMLKYQAFSQSVRTKITEYLQYLRENFELIDPPESIWWSSLKAATTMVSHNPVPAYTNDVRIVLCPDLEVWKQVYLNQLSDLDETEEVHKIRQYYETELSNQNLCQLLGHELAHHSDLFLDDFNSPRSNGIWFEEGMVEYISRSYFLSQTAFEREEEVNRSLVSLLEQNYGRHSIETFGTSTYEKNHAQIFCEYWKSYLAVASLVRQMGGDIMAVFRSYHQWNETGSEKTLAEWFDIEE